MRTLPAPATLPRLVELNFNAADPVQLARHLARTAAAQHEPLCLLIDCGELACLRTHGIGHFVSQLLLIRQFGGRVLLHNVNQPLARTLQALKLDAVFELADSTGVSTPQPAGAAA